MGKTLIYQIVPRLWGNMNEHPVKGGSCAVNGSGKFSDIDEDTLAYLKWCGYTHVWLTGIIRHSCSDPTAMGGLSEGNGGHVSNRQFVKGLAGSPYAIQDYYDVNPYLADNPSARLHEFDELVGRIHAAGLKVLIDFVPNHVARDYGVGVDKSIEGRPSDKMSLGATDDKSVHWKAENDFFYYPGQRLKLPNEGEWKAAGKPLFEEFPARACGNAYTASPNVNDWYETVKINYCDFHTATWDKMLHILRYWLSKGVDGFRCDMVELVPPEFFRWAIAQVKKERSETMFVAEVYQKPLYCKYVREVGFDLLYDKSGLYDALADIVRCDDSAQPFVEPWQSATRITTSWQNLGDLQLYMLNFLENHDEQRFASDFFGKRAERCYPALAVSLMMNLTPFMAYFGEEVGERGIDSEGFSGLDGRTTIFDWWSTRWLRALRKLTRNGNYLTAAELLSDTADKDRRPLLRRRVKSAVKMKLLMKETGLTESELKFFVKFTGMLRFAVGDNAISKGVTYDLCYCNYNSRGFDKDRHFAFLRDDADDTFLIVANFSSQPAQMELTVPEHAFEWLDLHQTPLCNAQSPVKVSVPANDAVIMRLSSSAQKEERKSSGILAAGKSLGERVGDGGGVGL